MKRLLAIRHAKSDWDNPSQKDVDRPLNNRGKNDVPEMASRLAKRNIDIDVFISSIAVRTETTTYLLRQFLPNKLADIELRNDLYLAPAPVFYQVVGKINDRYNTAAIVAHNPGITDFINSLKAGVKIEDIPTCGIFAVEAGVDTWQHFLEAPKHFLFFDYPRLA
jgi:phosphohistidine phosphatase